MPLIKFPWLEERKDEIMKDSVNGMNLTQLAKKYNCTNGAIYSKLQKWDAVYRKVPNYNIVETNIDAVIEMHRGGKSAYSIAKELGCGKASVLFALKKHGIDTHCYYKLRLDESLEKRVDEVILLNSQGYTPNEISDLIGYTPHHIWEVLCKNGIKSTFGYDVDEHFFDKIDNEAAAYTLGLFYSDGTVDNNGRMLIGLQARDRNVLDKIKVAMNYTGPLIYRKANPDKNKQAQWVLCINRKRLADQLIAKGCIPNKTFTLQFPSQDMVPDNMLPHTIRGCFCGDGCIWKSSTNGVSVSITMTSYFLLELQKILSNKLGISGTIYYRKNKNIPVCALSYYKTREALRFLDYIYKDATIYLERKFLLYQNLQRL